MWQRRLKGSVHLRLQLQGIEVHCDEPCAGTGPPPASAASGYRGELRQCHLHHVQVDVRGQGLA